MVFGKTSRAFHQLSQCIDIELLTILLFYIQMIYFLCLTRRPLLLLDVHDPLIFNLLEEVSILISW